jgi:K+ transporter
LAQGILVGLFRTSSALASAYGIAVATTMVVDGVLGFVVVWKLWGWRWWSAACLIVPLVVADSTFLSANLLKLFDGAWVPLLLGTAIVLMVLSWRRGTRILAQKVQRAEVPLETLLRSLEKKPPGRQLAVTGAGRGVVAPPWQKDHAASRRPGAPTRCRAAMSCETPTGRRSV